jgi:hypothetical protein
MNELEGMWDGWGTPPASSSIVNTEAVVIRFLAGEFRTQKYIENAQPVLKQTQSEIHENCCFLKL